VCKTQYRRALRETAKNLVVHIPRAMNGFITTKQIKEPKYERNNFVEIGKMNSYTELVGVVPTAVTVSIIFTNAYF